MTEEDRERIEQQVAELRELHWSDDDRRVEIIRRSHELFERVDQSLEDAEARRAANQGARSMRSQLHPQPEPASAHPRAPQRPTFDWEKMRVWINGLIDARLRSAGEEIGDVIGQFRAEITAEWKAEVEALRKEMRGAQEAEFHRGIDRLNALVARIERLDGAPRRLDDDEIEPLLN